MQRPKAAVCSQQGGPGGGAGGGPRSFGARFFKFPSQPSLSPGVPSRVGTASQSHLQGSQTRLWGRKQAAGPTRIIARGLNGPPGPRARGHGCAGGS